MAARKSANSWAGDRPANAHALATLLDNDPTSASIHAARYAVPSHLSLK